MVKSSKTDEWLDHVHLEDNETWIVVTREEHDALIFTHRFLAEAALKLVRASGWGIVASRKATF